MLRGPIRFTNALGGTADFIYPGPSIDMQSPAAAGASNGTVYGYYAQSFDMTQWEIGQGVYTSASGTFARTTVLANSSGTTAKINFSAAPQIMVFEASDTSQARANLGLTKRNYILNGGMQISQENGTSGGAVNGYFPVDMFFTSFSNAGTNSAAQVASPTPGGSPFRLRYVASAADAAVASTDYASIVHRIEGNRMADLKFGSASAKTITLQFGVKAPAGTYCVAFRNNATNRCYVAEYVIAAGEANTDVVKSVTLTADTAGAWTTDTTYGIEIFWTLMAGSSFQNTPNTWLASSSIATSNQFNFMGTINNTFELFDVSLTEGAIAPPFQLADFATELDLCQRYWEKTYDYGTAVGTGGHPNGAIQMGLNLSSATFSNANGQGCAVFYRTKRIDPTVTTYATGTGASGKMLDAVSGSDVTPTLIRIGNKAMFFNAVATTASVTMSILFHATYNARL